MSPESVKVRAEYQSLKDTDTATLRKIYNRSYRVCDLRGADKMTLVMGILDARFSTRRIEIAFTKV